MTKFTALSCCLLAVASTSHAEDDIPFILKYASADESSQEALDTHYERFVLIHEQVAPMVDEGIGDQEGSELSLGYFEAFFEPHTLLIRYRLTLALLNMEDDFAKCRLCEQHAEGEALNDSVPEDVVDGLCGPSLDIGCPTVLSDAMSYCEQIERERCPGFLPRCEKTKRNAVRLCREAARCHSQSCPTPPVPSPEISGIQPDFSDEDE